jgi:hypothetical protein
MFIDAAVSMLAFTSAANGELVKGRGIQSCY